MRKFAYLFALLLGTPVMAQQPTCGPFDDIQKDLAAKYGEKPLFVGLDDRGGLLAIFLNKASETWTALVIRPDGQGCFIGAGNAGQFLLPEEGTDG